MNIIRFPAASREIIDYRLTAKQRDEVHAALSALGVDVGHARTHVMHASAIEDMSRFVISRRDVDFVAEWLDVIGQRTGTEVRSSFFAAALRLRNILD